MLCYVLRATPDSRLSTSGSRGDPDSDSDPGPDSGLRAPGPPGSGLQLQEGQEGVRVRGSSSSRELVKKHKPNTKQGATNKKQQATSSTSNKQQATCLDGHGHGLRLLREPRCAVDWPLVGCC
jgi:hypothetical protein